MMNVRTEGLLWISIQNKKMTFIFVHGFQGWGSYDKRYKKMPYWGMRGGDLIAWLNGKGYHAYAASVSPIGSSWDRACELYAQLAGTRVDSGAAHSKEYRHDRYGEDYTGRALIPRFDADSKLVLIGHSFGGATVNLFADISPCHAALQRKTRRASMCLKKGWRQFSSCALCRWADILAKQRAAWCWTRAGGKMTEG